MDANLILVLAVGFVAGYLKGASFSLSQEIKSYEEGYEDALSDISEFEKRRAKI